jgi:hypothetical protein
VSILALNKRFPSITIKFLLPLLVTLLVIQWVAPAIGIHLAKKWYAQQGDNYELVVGDWSFMPWRGAISLGQVAFHYGETTSLIEEFKVNIGMLDLWHHKFTIESLYFDGLALSISNDKQGLGAVGLSTSMLADNANDTHTNPKDSHDSNSTEAVASWGIEIKKIELVNHRIGFAQPNMNMSLSIDSINIKNVLNSENLIISSKISLQEFSMNDENIALSQPLLLQLNGEIISPFTQAGFKGDVHLSSAKIATNVVSTAGFDKISLSGLELSLNQQSFSSLQLMGLFIGDDLLKLKRYTVNSAAFKDNKLITGKHEWAGLQAVVNLNEQGYPSEITLPPASTDNAPASTTIPLDTAKNQKDSPKLELLITSIQQAKDDVSTVHAINTYVDPDLNIIFNISEFNLKNINNKGEPINIHMLSNTDEYSQIKVDANATINSNLSGNMTLDIRQFDLMALSGYVEKAIGYHVNQGQLNFLMDLKINNGELAGQGKFKIINSQMKPSDQATMDRISKQISIPIETALSLIKDDHNNIEMSIPITGNMNSPDFGLNDLISQLGKKAVVAATMHYVKQAIFPYGLLLSAAGYVGDELFSITLTPITYQTEILDDKQKEYLKKVSGLMLNKDTLQLQVCAQVNKQDSTLEGWYAKALSKANNIKRYIVEQDPALAGRIVLCQPKVDEKTQIKMGF